MYPQGMAGHRFLLISAKPIVIMKVFGKSLYEYLWPVKWYVIASVIVVIFQYEGMIAQMGYDPLVARITQWLWEIFVAAAAFTLAAHIRLPAAERQLPVRMRG